MKKFDIEEYATRRIRELRGEKQPPQDCCTETVVYTSRRQREMRGEPVYWDSEEDKMATYCSGWIQAHKLDTQSSNRKLLLDNRRLGSYTVDTMGDRDGES